MWTGLKHSWLWVLGIPLNDFSDVNNMAGEDLRERLIPRMRCGNVYCIRVAFNERGTAVRAYLLKTESSRGSGLTAFLDGIRIRLGL